MYSALVCLSSDRFARCSMENCLLGSIELRYSMANSGLADTAGIVDRNSICACLSVDNASKS